MSIFTPPNPAPAPKVGFISLGCPKALVDSERILTQLRSEGYLVVSDYAGADLVVVNTCGFVDAAKTESLEAIGEALQENGKVIVTGCLGVRSDEIRTAHPAVLDVTGPHAYEAVMDAVRRHLPPPAEHDPYTSLLPPQGIKLTPRHYAYLKIAEGCNHRCSFCIIPSLRGNLVSRPIDEVLVEAENLVRAGVKELLVVSQDTSAYGVDLKYRTGFWNGKPLKTRMTELCQALSTLGVWVRLHYVYPYPHVDEVVPLMAEGKILPYLDIPLQHASGRILKLMKRPAASENTLKRIKEWRSICPDLTIRSTFIVGFPGESEDDFNTLLDFIEQAQLDRVGCFEYSPVAGAKANELPDPVSDDIKQQRHGQFMQLQREISHRRLRRKIGQSLEVLIDELHDDHAIGRGYADAPEIDGVVVVENGAGVSCGELVQVKITNSDDYDLYGKLA